MTLPTAARLHEVLAATWPAAATQRLGPWIIRDGAGGGSRVSAATATGPVDGGGDIATAQTAMRALAQPPLFMIRASDAALDAQLAACGYVIRDVTHLYAAPVAALTTTRPPPVSAFTVWPPLAIQADIWAAGGIGPARLAVMQRAQVPRTSLLGRTRDQPAGTAYVALSDRCAMLHALEIPTGFRRMGVGRHLTIAAAFWARDHGAEHLALATTQTNAGANALYASLGMTLVGQYHYRALPQD